MKNRLLIIGLLCVTLATAGSRMWAQDEPPTTPTGGAATKPGAAEELDETASMLLKKIDPSVVTINHELGLGSGYIITADGYILTNGHVVSLMDREGEDPKETAKHIVVVTSDDKHYQAKVIGLSLDPDVALIKIDPDAPLTPITLGNSDLVSTGQHVYAYGSPGGMKRTLTAGILSNIERTDLGTFTRVFQTDAPINPGNSGGPLLNEKGEVIGTNTYGGGNGIGFAIPINVAKVLRDHFLKYGYFKRSDIPVCMWHQIDDDMGTALGVPKGILVSFVEDNSYIYKAGLRTGDVIVAIDDKPVAAKTEAELSDFNWQITIRPVGEPIQLKVIRQDFIKNTKQELTIETKTIQDEPAVELGYQLGEIKELRYDDLGLGVKRITAITQYYYDLPNRQGVRVTRSIPNSAAANADIEIRDMITSINNKPINSVEQFQSELEKSLIAKQKFIPLVLRRSNDILTTALKPYYDLAPVNKPRKKILVFVPAQGAADYEALRRCLITNGAEFTLVSDLDALVTADNAELKMDMTLTALSTKPDMLAGYSAIVLLSGTNIKDYWTNPDLLKALKYAQEHKKVIGAIGGASVALINADKAFLDKKITTSEEYSSILLQKRVNYTGKEVQTDGLIITTTGFDNKTVKSFLSSFKDIVRNTD